MGLADAVPMSRALVFSLFLAVAAAACGRENPVVPSPVAATMKLQNLQVKELGLSHVLCPVGFQYLVHDELTFDIVGQSGALFVGASLQQIDETGTSQLGVVQQCPESLTPCALANVCLTRSTATGGQIRAWAPVSWSPTRQWQVFLRSAGTDSNTVTASITRPDALPWGSTAAIAYIDARRETLPTIGGYQMSAYNPRVAGRRIRLTREVWSQGSLLGSSGFDFQENQTSQTVGISGGITIAATPTELIVTLEERDPAGNLIATDRRSMFFR